MGQSTQLEAGKRRKTYHANIGLRVFLSDRAEDSIPVRTTKVSGSSEGSDCVLLGTDILDDDIVHFVFFQPGGEVNVDFDAVLCILFLNGMKKGVEPFCGAKVADNPGEVDLDVA